MAEKFLRAAECRLLHVEKRTKLTIIDHDWYLKDYLNETLNCYSKS
jgi:hypothetical protein